VHAIAIVYVRPELVPERVARSNNDKSPVKVTSAPDGSGCWSSLTATLTMLQRGDGSRSSWADTVTVMGLMLPSGGHRLAGVATTESIVGGVTSAVVGVNRYVRTWPEDYR